MYTSILYNYFSPLFADALLNTPSVSKTRKESVNKPNQRLIVLEKANK